MPQDIEEAYRISGQQLIEEKSSRNIITNSLSIDIGLSGGIPMGCVVAIGGPNGLGKTTIALQYAANAQNKFGSKVFFYPIEGRLTQTIFKQIKGIKLTEKDFEVVMPPAIYDKKDKTKVIGNKRWNADQWYTAIGEGILENPNSIHIVDSISALSSSREQADQMGQMGRGDLQKSEAQFCRVYGNATVPCGVTVFLLAQIQANTSGYGLPTQIKMGNAFKHQADIILFGKRSEKWKEQDGRIRGHDMIFNVDKSALGQSNLEVTVPLRYGVGIDTVKDVITHATNWGLICAAAAWYYLPFKETEAKDGKFEFAEFDASKKEEYVKCNGELKLWNWLNEHPVEFAVIEKAIKNKVGI